MPTITVYETEGRKATPGEIRQVQAYRERVKSRSQEVEAERKRRAEHTATILRQASLTA